MDSPQKRPPSLYDYTPKPNKEAVKAYALDRTTPGQSLTIERGAMRSALDGPGGPGLQASPNRALNGSKSSKQLQQAGDGISGTSLYEPKVISSARKPPLVSKTIETRSRSSA